jgi:hypothetical protein
VGGQNYSISGNRADNNVFTIDGVYSNEEFFKQDGSDVTAKTAAIKSIRSQPRIPGIEASHAQSLAILRSMRSIT